MIRTLASFSVLWLTLVLVGRAVTQSGHVPEMPESTIKHFALPSGTPSAEENIYDRSVRPWDYGDRAPFSQLEPLGELGAAALAVDEEGYQGQGSVVTAGSDAWPAAVNEVDRGTDVPERADMSVVLVAAQVADRGIGSSQLETPSATGRQAEGAPSMDTGTQPRRNAVVVSISDATRQRKDQEPRAGGEPDGPAPAQDATALDKLGEKVSQNAPAETSDEANLEPARRMELTAELLALRDRLRDVLAYHIQRPEAVERRSPWGIMHALIAYGVDTDVTVGGRNVNAIGWLCWNGPCRGQQLMYLQNGKLQMKVGPGVQGHEGQFLAMLAQSRVRADYPIRVEGQSFTVQDLIEYEKLTCRAGTELTFKLIGLAHYLDSDAQWKSAWGETWDIPRLIREELAQPVIGAACGGTHRMMGFSYAVRRREKSGRPLTGQWLRARKYVDDYHEYTFKLQNADGSFSTNWFAGPGAYGTIDRKLETTGHILEWLVYSLPQEQLTDPRVIKAVTFLTDMMRDNLEYEWEIGPKGHALHALAIYDERLFGGQPGKRRVELAQQRSGPSSR